MAVKIAADPEDATGYARYVCINSARQCIIYYYDNVAWAPPLNPLSSPPIFLDRQKRTLRRNHVPELGQRRAIAQGFPALGYAFCTAAHHALSRHTARTDTRHAYRQTDRQWTRQ